MKQTNKQNIVHVSVLIFMDFVVSLKPRKLKSNEILFSHWLLPVMFKSMNSRTHVSMHFVEITEIGAIE